MSRLEQDRVVAQPPICHEERYSNEHIFELVGIEPDTREKIPLEETRALVEGVQAQQQEAMQALIATRLRWICDKFAQRPEVRKHGDISLEDILQIGALAVLEAATKVDAKHPEVSTHLRAHIPYVMRRDLPSIEFCPTESEIIEGFLARDPLGPDISPEARVFEEEQTDLSVIFTKAGLTAQERFVMEWLYAGKHQKRRSTLSTYLTVTPQRVGHIEQGALKKIFDSGCGQTLRDNRELFESSDYTNYGLIGSRKELSASMPAQTKDIEYKRQFTMLKKRLAEKNSNQNPELDERNAEDATDIVRPLITTG